LLATILIETDFCEELDKDMMTHRGHGMLLVPNTLVDKTTKSGVISYCKNHGDLKTIKDGPYAYSLRLGRVNKNLMYNNGSLVLHSYV
jgi:hypothetical protein